MAIHHRPHEPGDLSFIYDSWIESFKEISLIRHREESGVTKEYRTGAALLDRDVYFKRYRQLVDSVLSKSQVTVACAEDFHPQIFGFIVWRDHSPEIRIVSYVYVKSSFRKHNIARDLYKTLGECHVATNGSYSTRKLIKQAGLILDPFFDYNLEKS